MTSQELPNGMLRAAGSGGTTEGSDVEFPSGDTNLAAYFARPAGGAAAPGIVVIHENRGLNPYVKNVARRAAAAKSSATWAISAWVISDGTNHPSPRAIAEGPTTSQGSSPRARSLSSSGPLPCQGRCMEALRPACANWIAGTDPILEINRAIPARAWAWASVGSAGPGGSTAKACLSHCTGRGLPELPTSGTRRILDGDKIPRDWRN